MRLVFLGTPPSAVPALEAVLEAGHAVSLVVTQPDRPAGRSRRPRTSAVKQAAVRRGLPLVQPERVRGPEFVEHLRAAGPELLVVVAYGRILPRSVLEAPARGAINVHFSLLPKYRGAAPVQWALAHGETVTGVTTMHMNERMDEGDLLLQRREPVAPGEHAPQLRARLAGLGADLLVETLRGLDRGELRGTPQDHAAASYAPRLSRRDGRVDPARMSATEIEGRIRGFDPWPGVWVDRRGAPVRLVEGRAVEGAGSSAPGTLEQPGRGELVLVCGGGSRLRLERVQPAGRRVLSVREAVNGRQLEVGDRLGRLAGPD